MFRVYGLGVKGLGCGILGLRSGFGVMCVIWVYGLGLRVWVLGFRVLVLRFRV
jgi:hypothetical protein